MAGHIRLDITYCHAEGSGPSRPEVRPWQGCCPRTPRPSPPPTSEAALTNRLHKSDELQSEKMMERNRNSFCTCEKNSFAALNSAMHVFFKVSAKPLYNHVMYKSTVTDISDQL